MGRNRRLFDDVRGRSWTSCGHYGFFSSFVWAAGRFFLYSSSILADCHAFIRFIVMAIAVSFDVFALFSCCSRVILSVDILSSALYKSIFVKSLSSPVKKY